MYIKDRIEEIVYDKHEKNMLRLALENKLNFKKETKKSEEVRLSNETNWEKLEIKLKYKQKEWIQDELIPLKKEIFEIENRIGELKNEVIMLNDLREFYMEIFKQEGDVEVEEYKPEENTEQRKELDEAQSDNNDGEESETEEDTDINEDDAEKEEQEIEELEEDY
jgi:hypothetical protein